MTSKWQPRTHCTQQNQGSSTSVAGRPSSPSTFGTKDISTAGPTSKSVPSLASHLWTDSNPVEMALSTSIMPSGPIIMVLMTGPGVILSKGANDSSGWDDVTILRWLHTRADKWKDPGLSASTFKVTSSPSILLASGNSPSSGPTFNLCSAQLPSAGCATPPPLGSRVRTAGALSRKRMAKRSPSLLACTTGKTSLSVSLLETKAGPRQRPSW
mmetsp:Transcript_2423/g.6887  ORF Transcript_2423/g.6887 Transcript_2423/m.6887 type:complete len:213 (-) Transcript_2423:442-1080(-)